jgi:hypothetical protein
LLAAKIIRRIIPGNITYVQIWAALTENALAFVAIFHLPACQNREAYPKFLGRIRKLAEEGLSKHVARHFQGRLEIPPSRVGKPQIEDAQAIVRQEVTKIARFANWRDADTWQIGAIRKKPEAGHLGLVDFIE